MLSTPSRARWRAYLWLAPLPLWLPFAMLLIIGTQGAKSATGARNAIVGVSLLTLAVAAIASFGLVRFGRCESYRLRDWLIVGIFAAILAVPVLFILLIGIRAAFGN